MLRNEYRESDFVFNPQDPLLQYPVTAYGFELGLWQCVGILAGFAVAYMILGFFALRRNVTKLNA